MTKRRAFLFHFASDKDLLRFLSANVMAHSSKPVMGLKSKMRFRLFAASEEKAFEKFRKLYGDSYNESLTIFPMHYDQIEKHKQNEDRRKNTRARGRTLQLFDLPRKAS